MTTWVAVRTSAYGLHLWPGAPQTREYLANEHRHKFHVELRVEVALTNDRPIEFHDLLDVTNAVLRGIGIEMPYGWTHFGDLSCEMIAAKVIVGVRRALGVSARTRVECSVFEDGENGATVETP